MTLSGAMYAMLQQISQREHCFDRRSENPLLTYVLLQGLATLGLVKRYDTGPADTVLCYLITPAGKDALAIAPDDTLPVLPDYAPFQVDMPLITEHRQLLKTIARRGSVTFDANTDCAWQTFEPYRRLVNAGYLVETHPGTTKIVFTLTGSGQAALTQS